MTEYFLVEQLLREFKLQSAKEEVNYTLFIEGNQMQQNLDFLFEGTATDVIEFWRLFQEERTNVQKAYVLGL